VSAMPPRDVAAAPLSCRVHDTLAAIGGDPARVLSRAQQPNLFDRLDWLELNRTHLWPHARLAIAEVRHDEDVMWLPVRDDGGRHGRALASWYTLAFAPLFTPGCDPLIRTTLAGVAARALRTRFDTINLWPLEPQDAQSLKQAFETNGWMAIDGFETAHWIAHTDGLDFDAYWARRPSRLRNTVRRRARKSTVTTHVHDRFDAAAWDAYEAIYAESWKPSEGSPAFLRAFAEQEGAAGTLRLGIATREGRPVAAQLWTVENRIAIIHKLAHLESEREHSPGTLLSEAMFRHVLDHDRPAIIDYGNGDEPYKADWMDERRVRHRLQLFNLRSLRGLAKAAGKVCRAGLRRITG